jgi:two-component system chemotaxis response regulator CheY
MKSEISERERDSILAGLESSDDELRRLAVERVIELPILDAITHLISSLGDSSWRVRKAGVQCRMPICVITTEGAKEDRDRAMALGADEYLTKPIQANKVLSVAKSLLKVES